MADIQPGDIVSNIYKPGLDWREVLAVTDDALWLVFPGNKARSLTAALDMSPDGFPKENYKVELSRFQKEALKSQRSQL